MNTTRNYLLDGLRGIAALAVVAYHVGEITQRQLVPGGYLAVDFFFILSGFVVDRAYRERLDDGLGAGRFMLLRIYRLYPMFLIGAVLGVPWFLVHSDLQPSNKLIVVVSNLSLLPVPFPHRVLFPLNTPAWSLFAELIMNGAFALTLFRAPRFTLFIVTAIGAVGMIIGVITLPFGLSLGWRYDNMVFGLARVAFGFSIGMIIARRLAISPPPRHVAIPIGLLLTGLLLPVFAIWRPLFDLGFAFLVAPAIVILSSGTQVPARLNKILYWLGLTSYPLYAIHFPVIQATRALMRMHFSPVVVGASMVAVSVGIAVVAERFIDLPARRRAGRTLSHPAAIPTE